VGAVKYQIWPAFLNGWFAAYPRVLDMKHIDAIFVRVDEAEIIPPCSTQCLAVGVFFRPRSIPATFVGESNNEAEQLRNR
jgi:hypothetical protein